MELPAYHVPSFDPVADDDAVVEGPDYRFTVLTSRLVRMEYAPDGEFEDRPTQTFWYRDRDVPEFSVTKSTSRVEIETEHVYLRYELNGEGFTPDSLWAEVKDLGTYWNYGDEDLGNLYGTVRTLDRVEGKVDLDPGLLAGDGWTVLDDTDALVFEDHGWVEPRDCHDEYEDLYLFGYGHDYIDCIEDFTDLSGEVPLLPRWALGNWWSRYEDYTQQEIMDLVEDFQARDLPFSVFVIDMDWHVVDNEYTNGWTGWTWNRDLFPDPSGLVDWLHDEGLKTSLNIHPADGVWPHEVQYEDFAEDVGIDPSSEQPIEFDASDPEFLEGYFEHVIHDIEEVDGVDFWWIDWQQWEESPYMEGLDPMWALNHLHSLDRARDGRRPFVLSRWTGIGSHRYPVGFSGDAVMSWNSMAFQPYLTQAGSNVAFGWWSHDIGGHFGGDGDPISFGELYTRWAQFGAFSPVNRIHTAKLPYVDKRPWTYGGDVEEAISEMLRWRHAFIPYLYTFAWRNHEEGIPLIHPMYYHYPETEAAYHVPQQYYFGSELVVAPHARPRGDDTNLSRQTVWLPGGEWFDFFTGESYDEGFHARYGTLDDVPVFARAGAIVPLGPENDWDGADNPDTLRVLVFPGANNSFDLYEDEGDSQAHRDGEFALTALEQAWDEDRVEFTIEAAEGDVSPLPAQRDLELYFRGFRPPRGVDIDATVAGTAVEPTVAYEEETETLVVELSGVPVDETARVVLDTSVPTLRAGTDRTMERLRETLRHFEFPARAKTRIDEYAQAFVHGDLDNLDWLGNFATKLTGEQTRAIVETLCDVGVAKIDQGDVDRLIMWNGGDCDAVTYRFQTWHRGGVPLNDEGEYDEGTVPTFEIIELDDWEQHDWELVLDYAGAGRVTFEGEGFAPEYHGDV